MSTDLLEELNEENALEVVDVPTFIVSSKVFTKAVAAVSSCVSSKDIFPVLKNIHVTARSGNLRMVASNSVLSAVVNVPVKVLKEGEATIPGSLLLAATREADSEEIKVKVVKRKTGPFVTISAGDATWETPLMHPDQFPQFLGVEETPLSDVNTKDFLGSLSAVSKAVALDTTQTSLKSVDVNKGRFRASDGVRFQQKKAEFPFDCQLPGSILSELIRRLSSYKYLTVRVGQTDKSLVFKFGLVYFVVQKTSVKFPNVDNVLLKPALTNDQELKVDRQGLLSAIRKVRLLADEETSAVVLSLNAGSCTAEAKTKGSVATAEVEAEWPYPTRHVSFNHKHLTDLLMSVETDTCSLKFGKDLKSKPSPLLLEDNQGFTAVLSQIRLDWLGVM